MFVLILLLMLSKSLDEMYPQITPLTAVRGVDSEAFLT